MYKTKIFILMFFSIIYCQDYDPETGKIIEERFDPKTGKILDQTENEISTVIENNQYLEKTLNIEEDFNNSYYKETMYIKTGFWSSGYVKNGKKISRIKAFNEFEKYPESKLLYDRSKEKKMQAFLGAGLMIVSPFLGVSTENVFVFLIGFYGGFFSSVYFSISSNNLIHKAVWIFNREAVKTTFKR